MRVLDVGAGNGVLIPLLRQKIGPSGALIAIDLSPAMLREFPRERIRQAHRVQADILESPLPGRGLRLGLLQQRLPPLR